MIVIRCLLHHHQAGPVLNRSVLSPSRHFFCFYGMQLFRRILFLFYTCYCVFVAHQFYREMVVKLGHSTPKNLLAGSCCKFYESLVDNYNRDVNAFTARVCDMFESESPKLAGKDTQVQFDYHMKRLALAHYLEFGKSGYQRLKDSNLEILPSHRTNE